MIDVEKELRAAFASETAARPGPVDLADRVIARGTALRRRRLAAISTTGVLAVALLVAVTVLRVPHDGAPTPGNATTGAEPTQPTQPTLLATGRPLQVALFGARSLRLPDGTERSISRNPGDTVTGVVRAAGGWVVQSIGRNRELPGVTLVRDDESIMTLADAVVSMAVSPSGDQIAVQVRVGAGQRVDVLAVPSGEPVAGTPLPGDVASAPIVTGWTGSLVLLSAPNGDAGPVASDVWDPAKGPYRSSMSGARLVLGPAAEPGQLLALEPDADPSHACLTWVDPSKAFTVLARKCQTGLRFGEGPVWSSPDGQRLVSAGITVEALDVRTMASSRFGLPDNARPSSMAWEGSRAVLFQLDGVVVRCTLDTSPCEVAPTPLVDGSAPLGFAR